MLYSPNRRLVFTLTLRRSKKSERAKKQLDVKTPSANESERWSAFGAVSAVIAEAEEVVVASVETPIVVGHGETPDPHHQDIAGVMMTTSADRPA